jgi:hypothetical protein
MDSSAQPAAGPKERMSYCRKCGDDRHHQILFEKTITWSDDKAPVDGGDTWLVLLCAGCHEVSFVHEHWFSEDYDLTDEGMETIIHRDIYPPAPRRRPLDHDDLIMFVNMDEHWIAFLMRDIYSASGMGAFGLAAMGARAVIDHLFTTRSGLDSSFPDKAQKLKDDGLISEIQMKVSVDAFEAGSAAAHRGYSPSESDFKILLDITETLLQHICILPGRARRQALDAEKLRANTPPRPARRRPPSG